MIPTKEIQLQIGGRVEGDIFVEKTFIPPLDCTEGQWSIAASDVCYSGCLQNPLLKKMKPRDRKFQVMVYSSLTRRFHEYEYEIPSTWSIVTPSQIPHVINKVLADTKVERIISNVDTVSLSELVDIGIEGSGSNTKLTFTRVQGMVRELIPDIRVEHWMESDSPSSKIHHLRVKFLNDRGQTIGQAHTKKRLSQITAQNFPLHFWTTESLIGQIYAQKHIFYNHMKKMYVPQEYFHNILPNMSMPIGINDVATLQLHGNNVNNYRIRIEKKDGVYKNLFDAITLKLIIKVVEQGRLNWKYSMTAKLYLKVNWSNTNRSSIYQVQEFQYPFLYRDGETPDGYFHQLVYQNQLEILQNFDELYPHQSHVRQYKTAPKTVSFEEQNTMLMSDMLSLQYDDLEDKLSMNVKKQNEHRLDGFMIGTKSSKLNELLGVSKHPTLWETELCPLASKVYFSKSMGPWNGFMFASLMFANNVINSTHIGSGARDIKAVLTPLSLQPFQTDQEQELAGTVIRKTVNDEQLMWYTIIQPYIHRIQLVLVGEVNQREVLQFVQGGGYINVNLRLRKYE
jgi:hypothetical protein